MTIEITKGCDNPMSEFFSSTSNTPETDAFMTRIRGIDGDKHWVPANTARRLERERDDAREQIAKLRYIAEMAIEYVGHTAVQQKLRDKFNQMKELRNE